MARPLRIEYEGAFYHVMNRGINHQDIFLKDSQRNIFLLLLEEISIKYFIEIHCFCLLNNHYHLLIRTIIPNLSKAMRHLNGLYTRRFNISEGRDGSIFRGRYKAILIEKESYLLQVSRYIHLNPVEANICQDPVNYKWSNYRSYIKSKKEYNWITTDLILSHCVNNDYSHQYKDFVHEGIDKEIKEFYSKSKYIFGTNEFIEYQIASIPSKQKTFFMPDINKSIPLPLIQNIAESVARYFSITVEDLKISSRGKANLARNFAIFLSRRIGQATHREISSFFLNITAASVSVLIKRFEKNHILHPKINNHLCNIINIIKE